MEEVKVIHHYDECCAGCSAAYFDDCFDVTSNTILVYCSCPFNWKSNCDTYRRYLYGEKDER